MVRLFAIVLTTLCAAAGALGLPLGDSEPKGPTDAEFLAPARRAQAVRRTNPVDAEFLSPRMQGTGPVDAEFLAPAVIGRDTFLEKGPSDSHFLSPAKRNQPDGPVDAEFLKPARFA
ncbi:hypothetical protein IEO21_07265 [Rhodonia placenta]|uniref:Uncharacterized protein n=1 Tax=Rhodonia placenta TaxID=104341 RepID=A0A8H7U0I0_9APHY|nr:hypothetical protein IEO21_07265 [Postia placenta]